MVEEKLPPKVTIAKPVQKTTFKRATRKPKVPENAPKLEENPPVTSEPESSEQSPIVNQVPEASKNKALEALSKFRQVKSVKSVDAVSNPDENNIDTLLAEVKDNQKKNISTVENVMEANEKCVTKNKPVTKSANDESAAGTTKPDPNSFESLLAKAKEVQMKRKLPTADTKGTKKLKSSQDSVLTALEAEMASIHSDDAVEPTALNKEQTTVKQAVKGEAPKPTGGYLDSILRYFFFLRVSLTILLA